MPELSRQSQVVLRNVVRKVGLVAAPVVGLSPSPWENTHEPGEEFLHTLFAWDEAGNPPSGKDDVRRAAIAWVSSWENTGKGSK